MKRWTFRIVLMLLLGVVTTVAVAWGSTVLIDSNAPEEQARIGLSLETPHISWIGAEQRTRSACLFTSVWSKTIAEHGIGPADWRPRELIPEWTGFSDPADFAGEGDLYVWDVADCRGWPALALWSHSTHVAHGSSVVTTWGPPVGGIDVGLQPTQNMYGTDVPRLLPLRPIFPGFLINTLFYAVIWFGLIFGWRAHLRMIRRWQGYCPMCNYDLRCDLDGGCPECGWNRA